MAGDDSLMSEHVGDNEESWGKGLMWQHREVRDTGFTPELHKYCMPGHESPSSEHVAGEKG
jgi:hypothetical protein